MEEKKMCDSIYEIATKLKAIDEQLKQNPNTGVNMELKGSLFARLCIVERYVKRIKDRLEYDFAITDFREHYEKRTKNHNAKVSFSKTVVMKIRRNKK